MKNILIALYKKKAFETAHRLTASKGQIEQIQGGVHDPGIFKAFFLAGGSGSGKTFVAEQMLKGHGLKFVNLDPILEKLLKQEGISLQMQKLSPEQTEIKDELRHEARRLMQTQMGQYIQNRLGLAIDGTGRNYYYIEDPKEWLDKLGYDTYMIFVDASLKVALQRNKQRARNLPNYLVKEFWQDVQKNKKAFKQLFGDNFILINNDKPAEENKEIFTKIWKAISKYVNAPIKNKEAKTWIEQHK